MSIPVVLAEGQMGRKGMIFPRRKLQIVIGDYVSGRRIDFFYHIKEKEERLLTKRTRYSAMYYIERR